MSNGISVGSYGSQYGIVLNLSRVLRMSLLSKDSTPDVIMKSFFLCFLLLLILKIIGVQILSQNFWTVNSSSLEQAYP